ncbi:GNAT family N-acetyltransferase [Gluconobacter cerinus]|uniref:Acetyltransferase n=1 Tax=Gluconobacter cerinus TaxID=38307 RepID=A0A1B6VP57_9PROT|nr:GNAT family N-acetyltransferase [Gluconobacter cerinus]OAJ69006.1 acetyltransferase [Gluconobacter cerinus]
MSIVIREVQEADLPAILRITNDAIEHTDALWISTPFTMEQRQKWVADRQAQNFPVFVAVDGDGVVCGYASYGPFRAFEGYAGTVEHSVYVSSECQGRGLGRLLLNQLIQHAKRAGFHVMVAGITAGNEASIALHHRLGFQNNGILPQVGRKGGRWLDLLFMTLCLEAVSKPEKDFP